MKKALEKERRTTKRRPNLKSFSIFVVIPKKGLHRLPVHDFSENGIAFDLDIEGESTSDFPVKSGDTVDIRFYLNNSLYISLSVRIARVETHPAIRRVGAEFQDKNSQNYKAFLSLVMLLDNIQDVLQVDTPPLPEHEQV